MFCCTRAWIEPYGQLPPPPPHDVPEQVWPEGQAWRVHWSVDEAPGLVQMNSALVSAPHAVLPTETLLSQVSGACRLAEKAAVMSGCSPGRMLIANGVDCCSWKSDQRYSVTARTFVVAWVAL